eukprot:443141-Rhodomonas_salina.2
MGQPHIVGTHTAKSKTKEEIRGTVWTDAAAFVFDFASLRLTSLLSIGLPHSGHLASTHAM